MNYIQILKTTKKNLQMNRTIKNIFTRVAMVLLGYMLSTLMAWAEVGDVFKVDVLTYTVIGEDPYAVEVSIPQQLEVKPTGNVVIPSSITYDGVDYAVTGIGLQAFVDSREMTSVVIPESIEYIGNGAFESCSNLESIVIPGSVKTIGYFAFRYCSLIKTINIPAGVERIEYGIVSGCRNLESITVEDGNVIYDSRDNCNAIIETSTNTLIAGCKSSTIPNGVESIDYYAFHSCWGLVSITIPESVAIIGSSAFYKCI